MTSFTSQYDDVLVNTYRAEDYAAKVEIFEPTKEEDKVRIDVFQGWKPRHYQRDLVRFFAQRENKGRINNQMAISIFHRRAGKTITSLRGILLPEMLEYPGYYNIVFPTLNQGRKVVWDGIAYDQDKRMFKVIECIPKELWQRKDNHAMQLTLINGSVLQIVGAIGVDGTSDHLRGINPRGAIFDEFTEMDRDVWDTIYSPIFGENGGWALFQGTPKGENHSYFMYKYLLEKMQKDSKKYLSDLKTVDDTRREDGTPVVTQDYIDSLREQGVSEEDIQQEFYCSFKSASDGSFYGRILRTIEERGQIGIHPPDPSLPAFIAADIGLEDANAFWAFQYKNRQVRLVWFHQVFGRSLAECFPTINALNLNVRAIFLPWDSGKREVTLGLTPVQIIQRENLTNIPVVTVDRTGDVLSGIDLVRNMLFRTFVNEGPCREGLNCLKQYRQQKNLSTGAFTGKPKRTDDTHAADALRTLAQAEHLGMIRDYISDEADILDMKDSDFLAEFEGLRDI